MNSSIGYIIFGLIIGGFMPVRLKCYLFGVLFFALGGSYTQVIAQSSPPASELINPLSAVTFTDTIIEFGIITRQDSLVKEVSFKSTGKAPFKFYDGVSECGCATIVLPKTEFKKGQRGSLSIVFKSPYLGSIEKKVTLVSNAGIHYLIYRAYVKE